MNKRHAVIGRVRLILVCYIRKYVIILGGYTGYSHWRPPNQNIGWDVTQASPAGLTPVGKGGSGALEKLACTPMQVAPAKRRTALSSNALPENDFLRWSPLPCLMVEFD